MRFYTEGITGYVDVKDVVKSMVALMDSSVKNERYILVSENKSFRAIFDAMAKGFNKKPPTIRFSKSMTEIAWRIATFISFITRTSPVLSKNSAKSIHNKNYFSNAKIKNAIDIEFITVNETINRVCELM